jgi:ABC-type multidrug transport system fused ATPase/permease subunit
VLHEGLIVESGTHDELLLQGKRYAHLVVTQLAGAAQAAD